MNMLLVIHLVELDTKIDIPLELHWIDNAISSYEMTLPYGLNIPMGAEILLFFLGTVFLIKYNIRPLKREKYGFRLSVLINACELIRSSFILFVFQIIIYVFLFINNNVASIPILIISLILSILGLIILLINGMLRLAFSSTQMGLVRKIIMIAFWWAPIANVFIFGRACHISRREYLFEVSKIELGELRVENEVCKTKYPILLVHGIFWRDWQLFNYWGRIPAQLMRYGAKIYYGNQQSATKLDTCAGEIKNQILNIMEKEDCEKVNIIAHSKGGIDSRYAISCLGMDEYVASLTTINSPHNGSALADRLLERFSTNFVRKVAKIYNSFFKRLGDDTPDFYNSVMDLTTKQCVVFNQEAIDKEGVHYQSYTSKMRTATSAGFPLNIGYAILKPLKGDNDGFVSIEESKHGEFLGCIESSRRRGISHGDMIDLKRENIKGFDVREFYVNLVQDLKKNGY
jgi:triacylglycerol lipase